MPRAVVGKNPAIGADLLGKAKIPILQEYIAAAWLHRPSGKTDNREAATILLPQLLGGSGR